jgi:hypothetical protein
VTRPVTLRLADLIGAADETGNGLADADLTGFTSRRQAAFAAERDRWALAEAAR